MDFIQMLGDETFLSALFNNGIDVACLVFMMYFVNTTLKNNNDVLQNIREILAVLSERIDDLDKKGKEVDNNDRIERLEDN